MILNFSAQASVDPIPVLLWGSLEARPPLELLLGQLGVGVQGLCNPLHAGHRTSRGRRPNCESGNHKTLRRKYWSIF